jgi:hypothetical protein
MADTSKGRAIIVPTACIQGLSDKLIRFVQVIEFVYRLHFNLHHKERANG